MKLNQDQIDKIKSFQDAETQALVDLGNLNFQYKDLTEKLNEKIQQVIKERQEYFVEFEKEMGKGDLDLSTFEFTPQEEKK